MADRLDLAGPTAAPVDERVDVGYHATGRVHLRVPPDLPDGPAPALVALHGYGQDPETMLAWAAAVAPHAVLVVPEAPSSFYRDPRRPVARGGSVARGWIADPDRDADDRRNDGLVVAALDAANDRRRLDPARTVLAAYSQGVGVATHAFVAHRDRFAGLAGVAGGIPRAFRPRLDLLHGRPVLWITGLHDTAYEPAYNDDVLAAWRAAGVSLSAHALDLGHDLLDDAAPLARAWLADRFR